MRGPPKDQGRSSSSPGSPWPPDPGSGVLGSGAELCLGWGWSPECAAHPGEGSGERGRRWRRGPRSGLCTAPFRFALSRGLFSVKSPASLVRSGSTSAQHPPLFTTQPQLAGTLTQAARPSAHTEPRVALPALPGVMDEISLSLGLAQGTCGPRQQRGPLAECRASPSSSRYLDPNLPVSRDEIKSLGHSWRTHPRSA